MTRAAPPLLPWQPCLLAYVAGILTLEYGLAGASALALLAVFPRPARQRPRTWLLLAAFGLGLVAAWLAMPSLPKTMPPGLAAGKPVRLEGRVAVVDPRPEGRLSCTLENVRLFGPDGEAGLLPGDLLLTADNLSPRPVPGDILAATARVRPTRGFSNPGTSDFAFLRRLGGVFFRAYAKGNQVERIQASSNRLALWREALRQRTVAALAPDENAGPEARAGRAMVVALLFSDLSGFAAHDLDLVRRGSLAHTLALSGMNVSYMVALGFALAWLLGKCRPGLYLRLPRPYLTLILAGPLVVVYCWLGGYSPSLYRAAIMFAGCGLLLVLGRHMALFDGLFLALAVMLAASPLTAYDARLQLSALAVAGIGLFWPPFAGLSARLALPQPAKVLVLGSLGILWTSLCAEAAVMPVIARLFGELNPNPWINVPWLPILGFVVTPLALMGLALLPLPVVAGAGQGLLLAAAWCCQGLMQALAFLDGEGLLLSFPVLRPSWPEMLGCFGLLACLAVVLAGPRRPLGAMLLSLALCVGPTAWRGIADSRSEVSLTVLDVGQGQAVVLTLPGGRRILVDGGGLFGNFDVGRAVVGPFLTDGRPPRVELALASHPHSDHIKGLISILQRFDVEMFIDNGGTPEGNLAAAMRNALEQRRINHASWRAGDSLDLGQGLVLTALSPSSATDLDGNNGSLVLRLTWNGRGLAVLPGDAERGVLGRLAASGADFSAAVLVAPHHGSSSSLAPRFYAAVSPVVAVASAGDGRVPGYPSAKVTEALARLGCPIFCTNRDGAVTVRFAGPKAPPEVIRTVAADQRD